MSVTITVTCDENYSPYSNIFVNSLNQNSPGFDVCIRAVNCKQQTIDSMRGLGDNVTVLDDRPNVSTARNILSHDSELVYDGLFDSLARNKTKVRSPRLLCSEQMAYCSNIKFRTIKDLLVKDSIDMVIYMDIDTIIRGSLQGLVDDSKRGDIAMFKDVPYTEQHAGSTRLEGNEVLYHGGLICVTNNDTTKQLFDDWVKVVDQDMFNWDVDEDLYYSAHHNDDVKVICVDEIYKDEELRPDTIAWSGAGQTKFTHDIYIKECKKYDNTFE